MTNLLYDTRELSNKEDPSTIDPSKWYIVGKHLPVMTDIHKLLNLPNLGMTECAILWIYGNRVLIYKNLDKLMQVISESHTVTEDPQRCTLYIYSISI